MSSIQNRVILASASTARKILLEQLGFEVFIHPTHCSEDLSCADPELFTQILAERKMKHFLDTSGTIFMDSIIITADTCISFQDKIIGKPACEGEAMHMLQNFAGNTHRVYSSAAVYHPGNQKVVIISDMAEVSFFPLTEQEIQMYMKTGEWEGAAGAYRIQNKGLGLISAINGSYFTIAGLPIHSISGILRSRCNVI